MKRNITLTCLPPTAVVRDVKTQKDKKLPQDFVRSKQLRSSSIAAIDEDWRRAHPHVPVAKATISRRKNCA